MRSFECCREGLKVSYFSSVWRGGHAAEQWHLTISTAEAGRVLEAQNYSYCQYHYKVIDLQCTSYICMHAHLLPVSATFLEYLCQGTFPKGPHD